MAATRGVQLTQEGKTRLEEELRQLREEKMPELSDRIQQARSEGDPSGDNSEYEAVKEEYIHAENRARDIEWTLEHAILIEEGSPDGTIGLGSHIVVSADDGDEDEKWVLVSAEEANPLEGRMSDESPVGQELLGKCAGDSFMVVTPGGEMTYKVIDVR